MLPLFTMTAIWSGCRARAGAAASAAASVARMRMAGRNMHSPGSAELSCAILSVGGEKPRGQGGHHADAIRDRRIAEIEFGVVQHGVVVAVLRLHAEDVETARHMLQIMGEILAPHGRFG